MRAYTRTWPVPMTCTFAMFVDIARAVGGWPPAAKIASQPLTRGAWQAPPSGRPARRPAVAGTIGKDHALESADKYAIEIDHADLAQHNIQILFPDLV